MLDASSAAPLKRRVPRSSPLPSHDRTAHRLGPPDYRDARRRQFNGRGPDLGDYEGSALGPRPYHREALGRSGAHVEGLRAR